MGNFKESFSEEMMSQVDPGGRVELIRPPNARVEMKGQEGGPDRDSSM